MTTRSWIRKLFTRPAMRPIRKVKDWSRLDLELLEDRLVPAGLLVNNPTDTTVAGETDLREAIAFAETLSGPQEITFDPAAFANFATQQTIILGNTLALDVPATLTITGPGANLLAISGSGSFGIFNIDANDDGASQATISGLTLIDGVGVPAPNRGEYISIGGAISNDEKLTLANVTISGNASNLGGGVYNYGSLTLTNCTLSGNKAFGAGGAIANYGSLNLMNSTISGNTSYTSAGGGGIANFGSGSLTNCTVSGNRTYGAGGGIANAGSLTLTNSTLYGNTAPYGSGGGIANDGSLTLTNATVSGNSATGSGGGIYNQTGNTQLVAFTNTLIAKNFAGTSSPDIFGAVTGSNNLIGDGTGMTGLTNDDAGHDQVGTGDSALDPLLAPLGDYGGPIQTMPLLAGSPAMDAGTATGAPSTDQRGFARVGPVDIGAFESQGTAFIVNTAVDGVGSDPGQLSLRQALNLTNALPTADTITFDQIIFDSPRTITLVSGALTLNDRATTTITGPGANLLAISGNQTNSVFLNAEFSSAALSGLTITDGASRGDSGAYGAGYGGGIFNSFYCSLTLSDCTISGNTAGVGGGIFNAFDDELTVSNSTISGNVATNMGGGIYSPGDLSISGSTIADNQAPTGAGIWTNRDLTMTDSLVSGNLGQVGAGIYAIDSHNHIYGSVELSNCTITGNMASLGSGGGAFVAAGQFSLINCTVSNNSASFSGGGLDVNAGALDLVNTIVAANTAATSGPDINGQVAGSYNLIGDGAGMTGLANGDAGHDQVGSSDSLIDPKLGPLADNGGPTQTRALLPSSPALTAGNILLAVDAQGAPLTSDQRGPGFPRFGFGSVDIGAFEANLHTPSLIVTTTSDNPSVGQNSLREAISYADTLSSDPTITFTAGLSGVISLTQGELPITTSMTITGPGASELTISGGGSFGIFNIDANDEGASQATISGLTLTDGTGSKPAQYLYIGGAISNDEKLTLANVTISGNASTVGGGIFNSGSLTLADSTISGNFASVAGGGIANYGSLTLTNCTISGNTSESNELGGGIYNKGSLNLTNCTISGNTAYYGSGGGIGNNGSLTLTNCTISGNSARGSGGGIYNLTGDTQAIILGNTIVAENFAATSASDVLGAVTGSYNLIGDGTGMTGLTNGDAGHDQVGIDPMLGTLADNGGPTQTRALLIGSPAIDAGSNALAVDFNHVPLMYDQRGVGFPRITNSIVDIGAYEFSSTTSTATTTTVTPSLASPVYGQNVTFLASVSDTNGTTPTGSVQFFVDGSPFGTPVALDVNGQATSGVDILQATGHTVSATYSPTGVFQASSGGPTSFSIGKVLPVFTFFNAGGTYNGSTFSQTVMIAGVVAGVDNTPASTLEGEGFTLDYFDVTTNTDMGATAPKNAGSYHVTASFPGSADYAATSLSGASYQVLQASLTITANSDSKSYGTTKTFSGAAFMESGLVTSNGDSITGVTETSTGSAASAAVAGSPYAIIPSNAAGTGLSNYTINYVNGALTVNPVTLTITANSDSKAYGATKTFSPTAVMETGLVTTNGDSIASVTETSTGAAASATVADSPYAIIPSNAVGTGLSNYTINYVNGALTVNPAILTITANSDSKPYGSTKTLSSTAFLETGLVTANGDSITSVMETSTGAVASATVAGSPYAIIPSNAVGTGLSNYTINYVNGALTVNPAILTITANSDTKPFGATKTFSPTAFAETGLVNSDSITGVTETSTGSPPTASAGGSPYPIIPSAATGVGLSNYTISYINGLLTVVSPTPTVTTPITTSITTTTATLGGTVVAAGESTLLSRGILYAPFAQDPNPTLHDGIAIEVDDANLTIGAFAESITGLIQQTTYSFVAFATNSQGPGYSSPGKFSTPAPPPFSAITGPATGKSGQTLFFVLTAYDPFPGMQLGRFAFHIAWGDGKGNVVTSFNGAQTTHAFAAAGTYTIQVSATDAMGNILPTGTWKVTISSTPAANVLVSGGGKGTNKPLSSITPQSVATTVATTSVPSSKVQPAATVFSPATAANPTANPASIFSSPARSTNMPTSPYSALASVMADWAPADEVINQCVVSLSKTNEDDLFSIGDGLFLAL